MSRFGSSWAPKAYRQSGPDPTGTRVVTPFRIPGTSTFAHPLAMEASSVGRPSGVEHVLVNGTFVVRDGENVEGARPGRPVLGKMYTSG